MKKTRFLLQSPQKISNGAGGFDTSWQSEFFAWGEILQKRMRRQTGAFNQNKTELHVQLNDVHSSDMVPGWRLLFREKIYSISELTQLSGNRAKIVAILELGRGK